MSICNFFLSLKSSIFFGLSSCVTLLSPFQNSSLDILVPGIASLLINLYRSSEIDKLSAFIYFFDIKKLFVVCFKKILYNSKLEKMSHFIAFIL